MIHISATNYWNGLINNNLRDLEEKINIIFINAYGLQDELDLKFLLMKFH